MPSAANLPARVVALGTVLMLALPALAGCLTFEDQPAAVASSCEETASPSRDGNEVERPETTATGDESDVRNRSLTGDVIRILTFLGPEEAPRLGADLAADQLRSLGLPVEIEHVSTETDADAVAQALRERLEDDETVSAVVGGVDNESTWQLLEEASRRRVPVVTPIATSPNLTDARPNDGLFFRVPAADPYEGRATAGLVWEQGCRSAVVLVEEGRTNAAFADGFRDGFGAKGGIVLDVLEVPASGPVTDVVDAVDRADAEAMVLALAPQRAADVLRAAYDDELTEDVATFLGPRLETATFVEAAGTATEGNPLAAGLHGATLIRPAEGPPEWFRNAYEHAMNEAPGPFAAEAYDAVYAAVLAAECAGSGVGEDVKDRLRTVWNRDTGDAYVSAEDPAAAVLSARACQADYVGVSSPANENWDARGEPTEAVYRHWLVVEAGTPRTVTSPVLVRA